MTSPVRHVTRDQAIGDLRAALEKLQDERHSICQVAAERNLFCHGFAQWTFGELRARYPQILRSRPSLSRHDLEALANRWQLVRQSVQGTSLSCDTEALEHRSCKGWDEFSDQELANFHREICGEEVKIVPAKGVA